MVGRYKKQVKDDVSIMTGLGRLFLVCVDVYKVGRVSYARKL